MKLVRYIFIIIWISFISAKGMAQDNQSYFLHTVQAGQTLYSISNMYNVSVAQITAINPDCTQMIYVGEVLRIPQNTASADYFFHTIKAGDTLYRLTVTYKVSAKDICDLNPGLDAENFQAGTVIRIPKHSAAVITTVPPARQETIKVETPKCRDMHKVKKKETVYSICKKYSLTEDELIAANPSIKTLGLQKGDVICIPYASPKQTVVAPSNQDLFSSVRSTSKMTGAIKLAVVLPFASDSRMVEYYEGLLIAVDSLKYKGVSMDIYAYDLSKENVQKLLASKPELSKMDIIIGPRDKNDIKPLADFAKEHKIRLVIPFTSKDNEAFVNPFVYQVNTPQLYLYPAVYDHFCKEFKKPYIIFIESSVKDDSKDQFIKGMKETLLRKGIPNTTISDNASLDDMTDALFSDRQNVFIPTSGTHVALIKIITKLELLVRANRNKQIALFGYPEWQTLTKEHLRQFFATNTYFYTSFYTNDLLPEAKSFERTYTKWYHKLMESRYPKYGMLGFDTGFFFLKGLSQYGYSFDQNAHKMNISPVQTGFSFERINNWSGFINHKVFFIHYTPQSQVIKLDFD